MGAPQPFVSLKRVRFFEGQFLSAKDLEAEQQYALDRQRRHNRVFHGYGVVSGLDVSIKNSVVNISEGMALDPLGNEIMVPNCFQVSLKQPGRVAYVVACYREHETDPVPVQGNASGGVEFSRVEESFEIAITSTQAVPSPGGKSTGNRTESGVVLARLVRRRGSWQLDRKFRRRRAR